MTLTPTLRPTVPAMEALLAGEPIPVLDHGFVRLVDYMGDDGAVVDAARVSYGRGTRKVNEDRGLIRYLMRHWHTSPFEQCEIKLHVKLPIFVARQWIRHRTANVNEMSGRYSELPKEFYLPDLDKICRQSSTNKQGRGEALGEMDATLVRDGMCSHADDVFYSYNEWVKSLDVARELSRIALPLSTYTEWYWKIDLHNLLHFLRLRADPHAQYEIRAYAGAISGIVAAWVPYTWEAYQDHRLHSVTLSRQQVALIKDMLHGKPAGSAEGYGMSAREYREALQAFKTEEENV